MSTNDKYNHFSNSDIQKYLSGELSAPDMHALERAALEDPFLADALEGMEKERQLHGKTAIPDGLQELGKRLENRIAGNDRTRVLLLSPRAWRIAAAAILFIGLGALTYRYVFHFGGKIIAPSLAKVEHKSQAATDSTLIDLKGSAQPVAKTTTPAKTRDKKKAPTDSRQQVIVKDNPVESYETRQASPQAGSAPRTNVPDSVSYTVDEGKKTTLRQTNSPESDSLDASNNNQQPFKYVFSGKVIDLQSNPIPMAIISVKGHRGAARTDSNGFFLLQTLGPASDSLAKVEISSDGYLPVALTLNGFNLKGSLDLVNNNASNVIRMLPQDMTTSNGTAMSSPYPGTPTEKYRYKSDYGKNNTIRLKGSGTTTKPILLQSDALPVNGWTAYQGWLDKNKRNPQMDSTIKGNEVISFIVNKKGVLSSFKIELSLSPLHDSTLIRLLRQGAGWRRVKGKKGAVVLVVPYY
jgi:hypothetical protein